MLLHVCQCLIINYRNGLTLYTHKPTLVNLKEVFPFLVISPSNSTPKPYDSSCMKLPATYHFQIQPSSEIFHLNKTYKNLSKIYNLELKLIFVSEYADMTQNRIMFSIYRYAF